MFRFSSCRSATQIDILSGDERLEGAAATPSMLLPHATWPAVLPMRNVMLLYRSLVGRSRSLSIHISQYLRQCFFLAGSLLLLGAHRSFDSIISIYAARKQFYRVCCDHVILIHPVFAYTPFCSKIPLFNKLSTIKSQHRQVIDDGG
jgi:hypothetical protein